MCSFLFPGARPSLAIDHLIMEIETDCQSGTFPRQGKVGRRTDRRPATVCFLSRLSSPWRYSLLGKVAWRQLGKYRLSLHLAWRPCGVDQYGLGPAVLADDPSKKMVECVICVCEFKVLAAGISLHDVVDWALSSGFSPGSS